MACSGCGDSKKHQQLELDLTLAVDAMLKAESITEDYVRPDYVTNAFRDRVSELRAKAVKALEALERFEKAEADGKSGEVGINALKGRTSLGRK